MNLDKIIDIIRKQRLNEEAPTMSMGGGGIAGSVEAGDDPPAVSYTHLTLPTKVRV